MIDADVRERIESSLSEIEQAERVRILYACESGSRAWGFASRDSDYDVRFIYVREREWYVRVDQGMTRRLRSTIERPGDPLDVCGWDLQKALWLLFKSNPPLHEWLHSPVVYRTTAEADALHDLAPSYYSPQRCLHHYLSMARGNLRAYLRGDRVWTKKYLYVLRPVLACRWIEAGCGVVPVETARLVERVLPRQDGLPGAVDELLAGKAAGTELDEGPRIEPLSGFLEAEVERLREIALAAVPIAPDIEPLNEFFRRVAGF